jgi:uncharacterized delta-60 repeat protein
MNNVGPILTVLLFALCATTFAQPGSLDSDFDGDGKVTTDFGSNYDQGYSVVIQPDGKILVAGESNHDFALVRYNTDGSLDNGFGAGGKVTTDFGTFYDVGRSVVIQPDGKIVVAGTAGIGTPAELAVARYNTDGTLDTSFSADGKVTTTFGTDGDYGFAVAIQSNGKIVVAGTANITTDAEFAVVRYNMDGTLDNNFGVGGVVTTDFGSGYDLGRTVTIQPDGKIAVAGDSQVGTEQDFAIARYNTDGTLDSSFGVDGKATTDFGAGDAVVLSITTQTNGKIIVGGYTDNGTDYDFAIARYNSDGSLDNSFGVNGKVTTAFGMGDDFAESVVLQPDGKIVASGASHNGTDLDFAIARYNSDGTLDNSFGVGGKATTDFGTGEDQGWSVAIQPNGRIIVAGYATIGAGTDFAVARYISGLDIGVIEFSLINNAPLIYPNPIQDHATLKYTLQTAETITIQLLDMQGKAVQTFVEGQHQAAGEHQQSIELAEALPAGGYLIAISSPKGRFTVQVVK